MANLAKIPSKQLGSMDGLWTRGVQTILASATTVIDSVPLADFRAIKYVLCIGMGARTVQMDINLIKDNSAITETIFGKIGQGINFSLDTGILSGNMNVSITNNESSSISAEFIKYKFL